MSSSPSSSPIMSSQRILEEYRLDPETAYKVFMGLTHSNMREIAEEAEISRNTVQNYKNKFSEMHPDERLMLFRHLIEEELWGRLENSEDSTNTSTEGENRD